MEAASESVLNTYSPPQSEAESSQTCLSANLAGMVNNNAELCKHIVKEIKTAKNLKEFLPKCIKLLGGICFTEVSLFLFC
jgi:hypothetical protein